jgi:hypothetical protein
MMASVATSAQVKDDTNSLTKMIRSTRISLPDLIRFDPVMEYKDGLLRSITTARGTTKLEYDGTRLSKKTFPSGTVVTYFYDRYGKFSEARFSTGVVRVANYDLQGHLETVTGSDGYTITFGGTALANRTVVVTGPNDYHLDMTRQLRSRLKGQSGKTKSNGGDSQPITQLLDDSGGCYDGCGDWGGGDWGGGDWGGDYGTPVPDPTFERCMAAICDPADITFRRYCGAQPTPTQQYECYSAADREYWACYQSCR